MPEYTLKKGQERFVVVDGPFAGRRYEPGETYFEIPPQEADRFDEIAVEPVQGGRKKTAEKEIEQ